MAFRSLKHDFQNLSRLNEIITILVERGFHDQFVEARLAYHARLTSRLKHSGKRPSRTPTAVRETLEALGPTFVKLGQVLSLRPDLIPFEYCDEFRKLQDDVAPLTFPVIKGVVESELKVPLTKVFKTFNHAPLAAASISQVHEATLLDGTRVVVKVQRPGVLDVMRRDIDIMEYIATKIAKTYQEIRASEIVEEFKQYTERELDFSFELRNVKRFHAFFNHDSDVIIPNAYEKLSTSKVLVLEYLKGIRVSDKIALHRANVDQRQLAIIGFRAMFRQVFELGCFHADPHPGNLLAVKKGKTYELAFLDFGIIGFLDEQLQGVFLDILLALVRQDSHRLTRALIRIGRSGQDFDEQTLEHQLSQILIEWRDTTIGEERLTALLYKVLIVSHTQHLRMPSNVVLVAKALVTIEGTGVWLDPNINIATEAKPLLQHLARKQYNPSKLREELLQGGRDLSVLAHELPEAAEILLDRIKKGKVELTIDKKEFKWVARDYDLEVSKQNIAVIAAAFCIGSALLAAVAPELRFLNIPLYDWGFGCFLLMLVFLFHITMKIHKYLKRDV